MNIEKSYLFVPGNNLPLIRKAIASEADCIIIDLEDAVALTEKLTARNIAVQALQECDHMKPLYIRINDISTEFWKEDLKAAVHYGATGVVIPKAESYQAIEEIGDHILEWTGPNGIHIIPLIETAKGVQFAYEIASAHKLVTRLAFGSIDFALDINCEVTADGLELLYTRSKIVIASKAAGISSPIDAVYPKLNELKGLEKEAKHAKQIGFCGKLLIHPKQIDIVHTVFCPSDKQVEKARKIVEAFEEAELQGVASIKLDNMLVDYPVYKKAKAILSLVTKRTNSIPR